MSEEKTNELQCFFVFAVLRFQSGALHMLGKCSTTELHPQSLQNFHISEHICIPSYLGGRDQEDLGSRPAWANSW
jgi:hypothetical protein